VVFSKGARNSNVPIPNIPPAILYVMAFEWARSSIKIKSINNQLIN
jgi:hypothetical protein